MQTEKLGQNDSIIEGIDFRQSNEILQRSGKKQVDVTPDETPNDKQGAISTTEGDFYFDTVTNLKENSEAIKDAKEHTRKHFQDYLIYQAIKEKSNAFFDEMNAKSRPKSSMKPDMNTRKRN